jgi:hypothetical protein
MLTNAQWQNDNAPVRSCPGGKWCCGDESCCNIASSVFALAATVGPTSTHTSSPASSTIFSPASISTATSLSTTQLGSTIATSTSVPTLLSTNLPASGAGISTPAKIGIGVGIPVVVILLGIIGVLLWKLKRRKNSKMPSELHGGHEKAGGGDVYAHHIAPVELDGQDLPVEAGGVSRAELTGDEGAIIRTDHSRRK